MFTTADATWQDAAYKTVNIREPGGTVAMVVNGHGKDAQDDPPGPAGPCVHVFGRPRRFRVRLYVPEACENAAREFGVVVKYRDEDALFFPATQAACDEIARVCGLLVDGLMPADAFVDWLFDYPGTPPEVAAAIEAYVLPLVAG